MEERPERRSNSTTAKLFRLTLSGTRCISPIINQGKSFVYFFHTLESVVQSTLPETEFLLWFLKGIIKCDKLQKMLHLPLQFTLW